MLFDKGVPNQPSFIDDDVATHMACLLNSCRKAAFGIDSGETNSGERYECCPGTNRCPPLLSIQD
jgi:hypothetical protein